MQNTEQWAYKLIETGRKMQGGIKETAYQIHVENNEFDVIATLDTDSKKANDRAKLIASAPELLEALKLICAGAPDVYPEQYEGDNHDDTAFYASEQTHFNLAYIARAAIAKATGEQA